jgi:hypothetical protein
MLISTMDDDRCRYAFIVNWKPFKCPFFVERCRRSKIELKHIRFYEPNVVYVPKNLEHIIHLLTKIVDVGDRGVALDTVCEAISYTVNFTNKDVVCLQTKVVEEVIKHKLKASCNNYIIT